MSCVCALPIYCGTTALRIPTASLQAIALAIPLIAGSVVSATTADNVLVWYVHIRSQEGLITSVTNQHASHLSLYRSLQVETYWVGNAATCPITHVLLMP